MTNPVDDRKFTGPLVRALRGHVDAFAASMAGPRPPHSRVQAVRPSAVSWVFFSTVVAWAEDHRLVNPWLRGVSPELRRRVLDREGGPVGWLSAAINSVAVHPATRCLLDPRYSQLRDHTPSDDVCRDLIDWWGSGAPSFAYDVQDGPASISGWLPGDLLQALSVERVKAHAFAQSPWWVADFLIDMTLTPAADEFRGETIRAIDPTCGTGHVLVRMVDRLWEWYTTGTLASRQVEGRPPIAGGPVLEPADAIRRIVAGVDGCEIDPLTAAVARLRMVVAVGELMHRAGLIPTLRLDSIPPFQPRVAVGDSLLAGVVSKVEYARLHPRLAEICNLGYDEPAESRLAEVPPAVVVTKPAQLDLFEEAS